MPRPGNATDIPRSGCWRDRAAARCCSAASPFSLQPGWKTYWRTPGDSGVPPRFDFSKSENVEAVTVLWPAPTKFDDGAGGHSLGYHDQVVLPLRIVAKNADKPVTLRADDQLRGLREALHSRRSQCRARLRQRREHRGQRAVRGARYRAEARQCRRPQSAHHPRRQARRQVHRAGRCGRARCQGRQPVRRRADAGLGAAGSETARAQPARGQALFLRTGRRCRRAPSPKAPRSN